MINEQDECTKCGTHEPNVPACPACEPNEWNALMDFKTRMKGD